MATADPITAPDRPAPTHSTPQPYQEISARCIRDLARINEESLPKILEAAGAAISLLTNNPVRSASLPPDTFYNRETTFKTTTSALFAVVNETRDEIKERVALLASLNIIPAETQRFAGGIGVSEMQKAAMSQEQLAQHQENQRAAADAVTNGGLGDFDVGVLNARARAGREGGDVLERVEGLLEDMIKRIDGKAENGDREMADG